MPSTSFPILTTERLVLNELKKTDRKQLFEIFSDPLVTAHYDVERFSSIKDADKLIEYFANRFKSKVAMRWAIRLKGQPKLIGSCGFNSIDRWDACTTVGYDLSPEHWGNGYASEAFTAILEFVFSSKFPFKMNRVESLIMNGNTPSVAVSEKAGFKFEGTMRERCFSEGEHHDMNLYSLIRRDYKSR